MIRATSPLKQMQFASKLKMIDNHIQRTEANLHSGNWEYEDMIRVMAVKLTLDPPQQILPFTPKTVVFDTFQSRNYIIRQQAAPKGKNFILNVNTYVPIKLEVKVNDSRSKFYNFEGNKAIQIFQPSFDEVTITATVKKVGIFSSVKFYLDLIQVQYVSPKKTSVKLRPNIDKQLEEYLASARGRSAQILKNREVMRSRQKLMRKTSNECKAIRNVELVRSKSQYQTFEKKKSLYIKHVRKMSPVRVRILEEHEQRYHYTKKSQIAKLTCLIYTAKLATLLYDNCLRQSRNNLRKMKTIMLCHEFIKIIKNKFRLKMTEKARLRLALHHTLQFIPTTIRTTSIKNAKNTLLEFLTPFMDYRTIEEVGANSQLYLTSIIKIQKYVKRKKEGLRQSIIILIQCLSKQHKIAPSVNDVGAVVEKYVQICQKTGKRRPNIFSKKEELILLLRKSSNL